MATETTWEGPEQRRWPCEGAVSTEWQEGEQKEQVHEDAGEESKGQNRQCLVTSQRLMGWC